MLGKIYVHGFTIGECRTIGFEAKVDVVFFFHQIALFSHPNGRKIGIGRRQLHSQSFFGNKPKQILSAIADLSGKRKQTVGPSSAPSGGEKIQL